MNYTAIIQARMGSKRLPGKSLMKIGEYTLLEILVKRLLLDASITEVIIATSLNQSDDEIDSFASSMNVTCHRGDEQDVLSRFAEAAAKARNSNIIEIYGDSPLFCSEVFNSLRIKYETNTDLVVTNALKTTYIPGLEMYIYSCASMQYLNSFVSEQSELREHVGYNFHHSGQFNVHNITAERSISELNHFHLEVDELSDLKFLNRFLNASDPTKITLSEILNKLRHEDGIVENMQVKRRWKKYRDC
jgi:spore coat polysaccharide biosynthesis protein SpsF (cytidylyltransferase family)